MSTLSPLITEQEIEVRVRELGKEIDRDYANEPLVLLCVLKGAFVFCADLAREISSPVTIEFLGVKSYGNSTTSSGEVRITHDLTNPVHGKHLLIVEDIVDTGLTSAYLLRMLASRGAKSVKLCSLLHKPSRTAAPVDIDYLGFTIADHFVVGYGLDVAGRYRNLKGLNVYKEK